MSGLAERLGVCRPLFLFMHQKSEISAAPTASSTLTPPRRPADSPPTTCGRWSALPRRAGSRRHRVGRVAYWRPGRRVGGPTDRHAASSPAVRVACSAAATASWLHARAEYGAPGPLSLSGAADCLGPSAVLLPLDWTVLLFWASGPCIFLREQQSCFGGVADPGIHRRGA